MGTFRADCPHSDCRTKNVTFETLASSLARSGKSGSHLLEGAEYNLFGTCSACRKGAVFYVRLTKHIQVGQNLENLSTFDVESRAYVINILPSDERRGNLLGVPAPVLNAITEADANCDDSRWSSASAGYRMAVERSLKLIDSDGTGSLYKRIEAMKGKLPQELIDLLHEVRFLGNDTVHGLDDPDPQDVILGRRFAHLFLTYVFELPFQIDEAKSKRAV